MGQGSALEGIGGATLNGSISKQGNSSVCPDLVPQWSTPGRAWLLGGADGKGGFVEPDSRALHAVPSKTTGQRRRRCRGGQLDWTEPGQSVGCRERDGMQGRPGPAYLSLPFWMEAWPRLDLSRSGEFLLRFVLVERTLFCGRKGRVRSQKLESPMAAGSVSLRCPGYKGWRQVWVERGASSIIQEGVGLTVDGVGVLFFLSRPGRGLAGTLAVLLALRPDSRSSSGRLFSALLLCVFFE